jgi:hypothetical protein
VITYKYNNRCSEIVKDESIVKFLTKTKGKKTNIMKEIYYYVALYNDSYYWLFENEEKTNCELEMTVNFKKLINMRLEVDECYENKW